jgi:hypothetical protein
MSGLLFPELCSPQKVKTILQLLMILLFSSSLFVFKGSNTKIRTYFFNSLPEKFITENATFNFWQSLYTGMSVNK